MNKWQGWDKVIEVFMIDSTSKKEGKKGRGGEDVYIVTWLLHWTVSWLWEGAAIICVRPMGVLPDPTKVGYGPPLFIRPRTASACNDLLCIVFLLGHCLLITVSHPPPESLLGALALWIVSVLVIYVLIRKCTVQQKQLVVPGMLTCHRCYSLCFLLVGGPVTKLRGQRRLA